MSVPKKNRATALLAVVVLSAGLASSPHSRAQPLPSGLARLHERLDSARARVLLVQRQARSVAQQIESLDIQVASASRALAAAGDLASRTQQKLGLARRRVTEQRVRYERLSDQTTEIAVEMYKSGPTSDLDVVLSAGNVGDLLSTIQYVDAASRNRLKVARIVERTRARLHHSESLLEGTVAAAIRARDERAVEAQRLTELRHAQSDKLSALRKRIVDQRSEAAHIAAASRRVSDRLMTASASRYAGSATSAGFSWPVNGTITSGFGQRWGRLHAGIDIDCVTGDPIRAAQGGRVISATNDASGYGLYVVIDHGGGYGSLYGHASQMFVAAGEKVRPGQLIEACGATGDATGDHLHFETRVNGRPVDPLPYLP